MTTPTELSELESAIAGAIPNCDAFTDPHELQVLRDQIKRSIFALKGLQNYCEAKQHGMEMRLAGKIESAIKFEDCTDKAYAILPEMVKTW